MKPRRIVACALTIIISFSLLSISPRGVAITQDCSGSKIPLIITKGTIDTVSFSFKDDVCVLAIGNFIPVGGDEVGSVKVNLPSPPSVGGRTIPKDFWVWLNWPWLHDVWLLTVPAFDNFYKPEQQSGVCPSCGISFRTTKPMQGPFPNDGFTEKFYWKGSTGTNGELLEGTITIDSDFPLLQYTPRIKSITYTFQFSESFSNPKTGAEKDYSERHNQQPAMVVDILNYPKTTKLTSYGEVARLYDKVRSVVNTYKDSAITLSHSGRVKGQMPFDLQVLGITTFLLNNPLSLESKVVYSRGCKGVSSASEVC